MSDGKVCISSEQALSILPDGEYVHTFINGALGLIGADWDKKEIEKKIKSSDIRELTGALARGMNHGLVVYNKSAKYQRDLLFIETSEDKVTALEAELQIS